MQYGHVSIHQTIVAGNDVFVIYSYLCLYTYIYIYVTLRFSDEYAMSMPMQTGFSITVVTKTCVPALTTP